MRTALASSRTFLRSSSGSSHTCPDAETGREPAPARPRPGPRPARPHPGLASSCRRFRPSRRLLRPCSSVTRSSLSARSRPSSALRSAAAFLRMRDTCGRGVGGEGGADWGRGAGRATPYLAEALPLLLLPQPPDPLRRLALRPAQTPGGHHSRGDSRFRFRLPAGRAPTHAHEARPALPPRPCVAPRKHLPVSLKGVY